MNPSCLACKHRPYGDQRLYVECLISAPFWSKRKPKPKNNGANCKRFEEDHPPEAPR